MEQGQPSSTAIMCAMRRVYHLLWDDDPKVFADSLALALSGCTEAEALRAAWDTLSTRVAAETGRLG